MEYIVSARKYRPTTFQSVVGQANITTTLKNAIKGSQLAHAYLFCGPRGVGKTTCARIFAKTINCSNINEDFEACNVCESCEAFQTNRSYNIHELDAASNNSVEDIRSLTDKVRVPPQMGKYSVYIIDEVHMLSQSAFNAFLKTLEEPPRHAIFILATTEKHKILPTILSRCQIFDFNRISIQDAVNHLKYVAQSEGVTAEEEGLNVIAQKADGAMRDALSIFDQVVAFTGKNITYNDVIENLNVLDYDFYFRLTDAFLAEDHMQALLILDEILKQGFDAQHFISGLSSHFRDLLVCQDQSTIKLMEVGASIKQRYAQQAASCQIDFLYEALKIATECEFQYRLAKNKRLHVEFALIKMARIYAEKKVAEQKSGMSIKKKKLQTPQKQVVDKIAANPVKGDSAPTAPAIKSFSLKDQSKNIRIESPENHAKVEEPVASLPTGSDLNLTFSQESLAATWKVYAETIQTSNLRLYSILMNHVPVLSGEHTLQLTLRNTTQKKEILLENDKLLSYLRRELKNHSICFEMTISQDDTGPQKAFTAADKLKVMMEKNPTLLDLKQKFGLDLE